MLLLDNNLRQMHNRTYLLPGSKLELSEKRRVRALLSLHLSVRPFSLVPNADGHVIDPASEETVHSRFYGVSDTGQCAVTGTVCWQHDPIRLQLRYTDRVSLAGDTADDGSATATLSDHCVTSDNTC